MRTLPVPDALPSKALRKYSSNPAAERSWMILLHFAQGKYVPKIRSFDGHLMTTKLRLSIYAILLRIFLFSQRLQCRSSVAGSSLNIKAGSYFSRQNMVISGNNSQKREQFDDSPFHVNGMPPVPPVLDCQIDWMAIQYMLKQMKLTVKRLKLLIFGKARNRDWFEVYLTIFVLPSSLEIVQARQVEIVAKWNTKVRCLSLIEPQEMSGE